MVYRVSFQRGKLKPGRDRQCLSLFYKEYELPPTGVRGRVGVSFRVWFGDRGWTTRVLESRPGFSSTPFQKLAAFLIDCKGQTIYFEFCFIKLWAVLQRFKNVIRFFLFAPVIFFTCNFSILLLFFSGKMTSLYLATYLHSIVSSCFFFLLLFFSVCIFDLFSFSFWLLFF